MPLHGSYGDYIDNDILIEMQCIMQLYLLVQLCMYNKHLPVVSPGTHTDVTTKTIETVHMPVKIIFKFEQ